MQTHLRWSHAAAGRRQMSCRGCGWARSGRGARSPSRRGSQGCTRKAAPRSRGCSTAAAAHLAPPWPPLPGDQAHTSRQRLRLVTSACPALLCILTEPASPSLIEQIVMLSSEIILSCSEQKWAHNTRGLKHASTLQHALSRAPGVLRL